jgi:transketolase
MNTNPKLKSVDELNEMARQIRRDIINMLLISQSGHSGGPLDMADIFAALYFNQMNLNEKEPYSAERDYLRQINGRLQGHPAPLKTHGLPGVEIASGSLGQGLSIAVGAALALRLDKKPNYVYCVSGDGELQEGQIWEAVMTAAHHKIDNITYIIDKNDCQIDNRVQNVLNLDPIADKFAAFNWKVYEIDGHNMQEVLDTLKEAKEFKGMPKVIIAKTFMGRGVSFMEDNYKWHGVPPNKEQGEQALKELAPTKYGDFV